MERGIFLAPIQGEEFEEAKLALFQILGNTEVISIESFHDNSQEIERVYSVYCVTCSRQQYVLKKTNEQEVEIYAKYLEGHSFKVPQFYGATKIEEQVWILTEYIEGTDGKRFNQEIASHLAKNLSDIMNVYWVERDFGTIPSEERFNRYWKRINQRKECLAEYPVLNQAYDVFLERQKTCPRTLCNGDLMQVNMIWNQKDVYLIDWAFGGYMPYALEVARVISHGTDTDFAYYMTDELREQFTREVYQNLTQTQLSFEEFYQDVKLACLNENIEFLEYYFNHPEEQRDRYFEFDFNRATMLANDILNRSIVES